MKKKVLIIGEDISAIEAIRAACFNAWTEDEVDINSAMVTPNLAAKDITIDQNVYIVIVDGDAETLEEVRSNYCGVLVSCSHPQHEMIEAGANIWCSIDCLMKIIVWSIPEIIYKSRGMF